AGLGAARRTPANFPLARQAVLRVHRSRRSEHGGARRGAAAPGRSKPDDIPSEDRLAYSQDEGSPSLREEGNVGAGAPGRPKPGDYPLGGSACVLARRGAVILARRGERWSRSAGPPQARRPSPWGIGLRTRKTRGRHPCAKRGTLEPGRRAAPSPATIPLGDRLAYSQDEGPSSLREEGNVGAGAPGRPKPGDHPLGGSACVLARRGAVILARRGERWSRSAGPPQARRPSPRGIGLRTRKTRGRHQVAKRGTLEPERRAAPSPATIPSGDRLAYSQDEGSSSSREEGNVGAGAPGRPKPGDHPLGGSACVLARRGAVILARRGERWSRSAGPPQTRRPSPWGIG